MRILKFQELLDDTPLWITAALPISCLRYNRSSFRYVCEDNGKIRTDGKLIETTNSGKFLGII